MCMKDDIRYLEFGKGKILILLPSNWLTSRSFKSIAKKIAEKYRVIVPDLYRGKSKYKKNATTIDDYVLILHSFIESLNIEKFYLVGFSFGGLIATEYSRKYPESIKKMILVSSINLNKKRLTLATGLIDYIKLFYHNIFSLKGIKVDLLWLYDGGNFFIKHTKQFFLDTLIITRYSENIFFTPIFPMKMLFASNDEFVVCKEVQKNENITTEIINGYHAWFFLDERLLVEKVLNYFSE